MNLKPFYKMKFIFYYFIILFYNVIKVGVKNNKAVELQIWQLLGAGEMGEDMSLKLDLEARETVRKPRVFEKSCLGVPSQGSELKGYPVLDSCIPGQRIAPAIRNRNIGSLFKKGKARM